MPVVPVVAAPAVPLAVVDAVEPVVLPAALAAPEWSIEAHVALPVT